MLFLIEHCWVFHFLTIILINSIHYRLLILRSIPLNSAIRSWRFYCFSSLKWRMDRIFLRACSLALLKRSFFNDGNLAIARSSLLHISLVTRELAHFMLSTTRKQCHGECHTCVFNLWGIMPESFSGWRQCREMLERQLQIASGSWESRRISSRRLHDRSVYGSV